MVTVVGEPISKPPVVGTTKDPEPPNSALMPLIINFADAALTFAVQFPVPRIPFLKVLIPVFCQITSPVPAHSKIPLNVVNVFDPTSMFEVFVVLKIGIVVALTLGKKVTPIEANAPFKVYSRID
ncbi:MAG: hypothetical protein ABIR30_11085 [Chitinophagaceae bacterium]